MAFTKPNFELIDQEVRNAITSVDNRITSAQSQIVSVDGRVTSIQGGVTSVDARITSVYNYTSNQVSVLDARITSVNSNLSLNLVSLSDVSLATSAGSDGYVVSWDNTQSQFVLSSISGGGSGDLTSLDNRITSVDTYFLNQVSVLSDRVVSIDARATSLRSDITSVYNVVSNNASVNIAAHTSLESRINTVSGLVAAVSGNVTALRSDITSARNQVSGAITALSATLRSDITSVHNEVSNAISVNTVQNTNIANLSLAVVSLDNRVTSVYNLVSNNTSITNAALSSINARVTSVESLAGDVTGPSSATNNAIAVFDSTTGKLIKQSNFITSVDDISTSSGKITMQGARADYALNVFGSGLNARMSFQATSGSQPGVELATGSTNDRRVLFRMNETSPSGSELQIFVRPSAGGAVVNTATFKSNGDLEITGDLLSPTVTSIANLVSAQVSVLGARIVSVDDRITSLAGTIPTSIAKVYYNGYYSGAAPANATTIVFNNTVEQRGNNYDTSTGSFTVPRSGDYLVSYVGTPNSNTFWSIMKNGVSVVTYFTGSAYQNARMFITEAVSGDQLCVKMNSASLIITQPTNHYIIFREL